MSASSLAAPSIAQALVSEPLLIGLVLVTGLALAFTLTLFVVDMLGQIRRMEALHHPPRRRGPVGRLPLIGTGTLRPARNRS
ncbi:MAG: hypothetical protein ACK4M0_13380 [Phreatobacter sp.]